MRAISFSLALIGIVSVWQAAAADTAEPKQYSLKQTSPSVGSSFRREIILAGSVPLDKRYAELMPEQKALLRAEYGQLKEGDEPPFPAEGLMPILSVVRKAHELSGLNFKGPLVISVQVDSNGKPVGYSVEKAPDPDIASAAALTLMGQTFKPAVCNGAPCAMRYFFHAELVGPSTDRMTPNVQVTPHM